MAHTLGIMAAITGMAVAVAPLLQLRLMLARHHSDDVSVGFLLVVTVGVFMWSAYGFALGDMFLALPNAVSFLCNGLTAIMAWRLGGKGQESV